MLGSSVFYRITTKTEIISSNYFLQKLPTLYFRVQ